MSRRRQSSALGAIGLTALLVLGLVGSTPALARVRPVGVATTTGLAPAPMPAAAPRYLLPISGAAVIRPFHAPPTPYAAGHRGVDLAAAPKQIVRAAAAGLVSFAGPVAGRGVVVITHPDGVRTEYEPLDPAVRAGQVVNAGDPIGVVDGQHDGCPPSTCLHWGARREDAYFDPMTLLAPLGLVHLIPWTNAAAASKGQ
jgi:murein DD-endopeptidase MepM/ murein hydrolase activator NlpD